ncbi:hypothetical protein HYPSUDRAFT_168621 [Hypholoma sublateritium FD-334 SS-4]|uniref:SET domain-containing protein n=1 Tax=Hypholoma sublateritium (strain FD-334 SS-4) TaxID=945553 RepID=A0A0D2NQD4_HYPSF|nr:hypothetical protein HYPSUDRAFT_168621 [Hypholoma sublateritium FD-334 SS-4]
MSKSKSSFNVAKLAKEMGNDAFSDGDYAVARLLYSQAMEIDPSQYLYPLNSSIANLKLERWRDAESDATKALKLAPNDSEACFRRGLARTELQQWSQARKDIQTFLDRGGCSIKGRAVLDAITRFEANPTSTTFSDRTKGRSEIFETIALDDNSSIAIRSSKIGGKGVFATREFKAGDVILREKPVLTVKAKHFDEAHVHVETALRNMSPEDLAGFLSLHNEHTRSCCADSLPRRASGIYKSNALMLNPDVAGVGLRASRFNHSCAPNACHALNPITNKLEMRALDPIREGEEIFITYNSSEITPQTPREKRQAELRKRYHFTCACSMCKQTSATWVLVDRIVRTLWTKPQQKAT